MSTQSKLRVRLVGAPKPAWEHPSAECDPKIPPDRCDAMLAWGAPTKEFLSYRGVRAWYLDEALSHSMFRTPLFREALRSVPESEFLHHSNPNPSYRFPCVTHYGEPTVINPRDRRKAVIGAVNNFGGRIWWLWRGARFRNRFILDPRVELFGDCDGWSRFRRWPWSAAGRPANYQGPLGTTWYLQDHVGALSQYQVNLCLENSMMPYYFTEKFVNAVRAGCVPIYHAHPTVRQNFLKEARWIDPADFAFDVSETISAALDCNAQEFRETNWQWLRSDQVSATEGYGIWTRIVELIVSRSRILTDRTGEQG